MKFMMVLFIQYIVFGIVDNYIMYKFGKSLDDGIEAMVKRTTNGKYMLVSGQRTKLTLVCAGVGNACSDFAGGILSANPLLAVGSFIGCMLVVLLISKGLFRRVA